MTPSFQSGKGYLTNLRHVKGWAKLSGRTCNTPMPFPDNKHKPYEKQFTCTCKKYGCSRNITIYSGFSTFEIRFKFLHKFLIRDYRPQRCWVVNTVYWSQHSRKRCVLIGKHNWRQGSRLYKASRSKILESANSHWLWFFQIEHGQTQWDQLLSYCPDLCEVDQQQQKSCRTHLAPEEHFCYCIACSIPLMRCTPPQSKVHLITSLQWVQALLNYLLIPEYGKSLHVHIRRT